MPHEPPVEFGAAAAAAAFEHFVQVSQPRAQDIRKMDLSLTHILLLF